MDQQCYAIVDIETTGGYAAAGGITEISIFVHDGSRILQHYEKLINPQQPIPRYIQALTGIDDELVKNAPVFEEVAEEISGLLKDRVFVAHNVNFDYSFLRHYLSKCGYPLNSRKLCTVRMSRKIIPGLPSYSLGNLCRHLDISINGRHRAGGDAAATVSLFEYLLQHDEKGYITQYLKKNSGEQYLPPNLPREQIEQLPDVPGVYYFHDRKTKIIYVGKAKNIRKRVLSHFSNNKPGKQKQEFLRNIYSISFETCATELMAFIFESIEIRRLWPAYNRSQKRFEQTYALYAFEDQKGYLRLAIGKRRKNLAAIHTFHLLAEGHQLLRKLIRDFHLCPKLCFMQSAAIPCTGVEDKTCSGACLQQEAAGAYNERVAEAIRSIHQRLPSFAVIDRGREEGELSCVLMEQGQFYGLGYLPAGATIQRQEEIKDFLTRYADNDYIRNLLYHYASLHPGQVVAFRDTQPV